MKTTNHDKTRLGRKCIHHLRMESEFLEKYLGTAIHLKSAIEQENVDELEYFREKQREFLQEADHVKSARIELKNEIDAIAKDSDTAVSMVELANELHPDLQEEMHQERRQVLALTREVERISRLNEAMLGDQ